MATLMRTRSLLTTTRFLSATRLISTSFPQKYSNSEVVTHTGQKFETDDYRKVRFTDKEKLVNSSFAIDLIKEDPVVVCEKRVVFSDGGGPLGHPRVYINLDPPGIHTCGYSGRKFVHKKYYDAKSMGESITYDHYLEQIKTIND